MVITYQGENYFRVQSGECVILIDPTNARSFKGANIILSTVKPSLVEAKEEGVFVIENQGEYERGGVRVEGWSAGRGACPAIGGSEREKTAYLFTLEGVRVAVLGHLTTEPAPDILENLQGADIVILPVESPYCAAEKAAKIVRQIEPGIVIPSLTTAAPKKFFGEMGSHPDAEEKITIKKKDIGEGAMTVRYLKA